MTAPAPVEEVFRRVLAPLPESARQELLAAAEVTDVAPGDRILVEGGVADALYLVVSGDVQLSLHQREHDLPVASVGPGEILGWSWLVAPHRWDFDATAGSGVSLARIPAETLRSVMERDPRVAAALTASMLEVVSRRLRDTRIQLLDLFARPSTGGAL